MLNQHKSQQKQDLKCHQHPQNEATSYCSEQNCSQNGLLCDICLQSDQHYSHEPNIQDISDLNQFFRNQSLKVNLIIENFKKLFQKTTECFNKVIEALTYKYCYIELYLQKINNNQILLGLKNLLDFDIAQQQLRNYLEIRLPKLIEILEQTYANQNLHSITYKISEEQNEECSRLLNSCFYLIESGNLQQAILCYDQILVHNPYNIEAKFQKGECLVQQNKKEEAQNIFEEIITINPNHEASLIGLGTLLIGKIL